MVYKKRPMHTHFVPIRELLRRQDRFRDILGRRQRECDLLASLRAQLPDSMREHCLDLGLDQDKLTLFLDSPAWATRVRFLIGEIAGPLSDRGITEIRVRVRPERSKTPAMPDGTSTKQGLTMGAAAHLIEAAEHAPDAELASAFRRLATRYVPRIPRPAD